jgi:hypothetical protein
MSRIERARHEILLNCHGFLPLRYMYCMYCTLQIVDRVKWLERCALQPITKFCLLSPTTGPGHGASIGEERGLLENRQWCSIWRNCSISIVGSYCTPIYLVISQYRLYTVIISTETSHWKMGAGFGVRNITKKKSKAPLSQFLIKQKPYPVAMLPLSYARGYRVMQSWILALRPGFYVLGRRFLWYPRGRVSL